MLNRLRELSDKFLDSAASKVQSFTGETERRQLVARLKSIYDDIRMRLEEQILHINSAIDIFNHKVGELNQYRVSTVQKNITNLGLFLCQFGSLKHVGNFQSEEKQERVVLPRKQFEVVESYIDHVDWSKDDVFSKTFFKSVFGVRRETLKLNVEATTRIGELELSGERSIELAKWKEQCVNEDIEILDMYQHSVKMISETIEEKVIPEMELIQAFLQCDQIKNQVLANQEIAVKENGDISLLTGTLHHKHFQFIKNTFMFFLLSSKIYNTPVLTNLMNNEKHDQERNEVLQYKEMIAEQQQKLHSTRIS
ncbi:hypothetical protein ACERII_17970 [Evansella sp. AB-rgal1]|uniref:hypothetical protein n=1 Tax=Evansella sp. AB-rgal1 TaxID=3242696 RepID=UPI00359EE01F